MVKLTPKPDIGCAYLTNSQVIMRLRASPGCASSSLIHESSTSRTYGQPSTCSTTWTTHEYDSYEIEEGNGFYDSVPYISGYQMVAAGLHETLSYNEYC